MKIEPYFNEMERHVCGRKIINQLKERLNVLQDVAALTTHFHQLFIVEGDTLSM